MESVKNVKNKLRCHDCGKEIKLKKDQLRNGVVLNYHHHGQTLQALKCNQCYKKNKSLANFQDCEVYSRVVGYLRPVQQWNEGKQEEYSNRKEYKVSQKVCL